MYRLLPLALLAACESGHGQSGGVVAFAEPQTLDLRVVDVETGADRLVDRGFHGSLSISPDGLWIAAVSTDHDVRLFGRDGTKRLSLPPGGNECREAATWHGDALEWCFRDGEGDARVLLPVPTGTPRRIATTRIVFSPDQVLVAYTRRTATSAPEHGDLVVENVDGSGERILARDVVQFPAVFSADGRFLLVVEFVGNPIPRVLRYSLDDGTSAVIGDGSIVPPLLPQVELGLDGSEVIAVAGQDVLAIEVATGKRRAIATLMPETQVTGAGFLERDRVLYTTRSVQFTGDVEVIQESVHLVDAHVDRVTLGCHVVGIAPRRSLFAVSCHGGEAAVMTFDDRVVFDRLDVEAIGFTADELGIIAVADDGAIEYLGFEGHTRALGHATTEADAFAMHGLNAPFVSYAP